LIIHSAPFPAPNGIKKAIKIGEMDQLSGDCVSDAFAAFRLPLRLHLTGRELKDADADLRSPQMRA
jgi:hypothetical protein